MRILKPEIAKARKEKILRWVVQQFVETRRPVGSQMIAEGALQDVSSATIRNIMKELEEEGYLYQPHTSGGRIPTDKAYRYYVDYLASVQKMAAQERQRIEEQYDERVSEVDNMLVQTSRLLAMLSGAAGFVYTAHVEDQRVQRLDFIPLAPGMILAVLVTQSGAVRHWPVRTGYVIEPARLRVLSRFINQEIAGMTLAEARQCCGITSIPATAKLRIWRTWPPRCLKTLNARRRAPMNYTWKASAACWKIRPKPITKI